MKLGNIEIIFASEIAQVMETMQGVLGQHEQWDFIRHVLLKRFNRTRSAVIKEIQIQSKGNERNGINYEREPEI